MSSEIKVDADKVYMHYKDKKVGSLSNAELVKAVETMKNAKQHLANKIQDLKKADRNLTGKVYSKMLSLNEDQANKYFKADDSNMTFAQRIDASLKSLFYELKKLEVILEIPQSATEDELESCLTELSAREAELLQLEKSNGDPVTQSTEYKSLIDNVLCEVDDVAELKYGGIDGQTMAAAIENDSSVNDRHSEAQFPEMESFEARFADIISAKEMEVRAKVDALYSALRAKSVASVHVLETVGSTVRTELRTQRQRDLSLTDLQYEDLLDSFYETAEALGSEFTSRYATELRAFESEEERKSREEEEVGVAEKGPGQEPAGGTVLPHEKEICWKMELDAQFMAQLVAEEECRKLEREIDEQLRAQISDTKVCDEGEGLDPVYLSSLMDKLAALYAENNVLFTNKSRTK